MASQQLTENVHDVNCQNKTKAGNQTAKKATLERRDNNGVEKVNRATSSE
jgi:hypothetical protein